jgi:hypothetical protein
MLSSLVIVSLVAVASDKDVNKGRQAETSKPKLEVCEAKTSGKEKDVDLRNCREAPTPSPTPSPSHGPKHKH